ncbi:acriflavin resistance protein [Arachidicoccus ginsenosidimutans]|uniref:efflux RND transporter permease subunit n=1 Tax=Arachidicoccus sp. BS20 TaxID=1850526 RepID=UPI0007F12AB7|nr:efflux RND transporter permease subunit [Arachidicoccus sp. BS20]ANI90268.1 acriflavin resistance protein [Arachidicoccus sp. BS20]
MLRAALKRPVTTIVIFGGLLLFSIIALLNIPIDIFPKLNLPTIYVIESYGGMSAKQMEGFFATRMQDQFLYINGIKNIESKNIQGLTLIKLSFYESTNMAEASAEVALQVNRCSKFFPAGALPPQVIRFDASSLPVGQLVFSSKTKSLKEIYDVASTRIRPMFATIPGLSAPPPFGANSRTVVVNIDPVKLRSFNISPEQVVDAIAKNNTMTPSGNIRIDSMMYLTTENSLEQNVKDFENIPLKTSGNNAVFVHDVGSVEDASDITVDYALVNGKRSVYIPVVKTADASTWSVVQNLKSKLQDMKNLLPDDVDVSYEFDQSVFVMNSVKSLMSEGIIGAILTGLMVLLFLRDWRSSIVVIITIPVAILSAILFLNLFGQTINMMTLSGLALAIGILVDQATVTIENIHQHLEMGKDKKHAILDACTEISFPLLLILLCILAVFAPSFIMTGVPKAMFLPLSLSIGFAMIISYIAAQTLVPVISNWLLKADKFKAHAHAGLALNQNEVNEINSHDEHQKNHKKETGFFTRMKQRLEQWLNNQMPRRKLIVCLYLVLAFGGAAACFMIIGKDLLPKSNSGQLQIRIKEPDGTRLSKTESAMRGVLQIVDSTVKGNLDISSAYVGIVPSSYGTSNLYVFNAGTNEGVVQLEINKDYKVNLDDLKDEIRKNVAKIYPKLNISFEPIELTEKIMAQGASNPIEVRVAGKNFDTIEHYATRLVNEMKQIPYLRDIQIQQPLHFPTIKINIDRFKLAQMGVTLDQAAQSITDATSSSRFTQKILWLDENNSYTYQVQAQVPIDIMNSVDELKSIPLIPGQPRPILSDVATFSQSSEPGEYDRSGPRRFVTVGANIYKKDLGSATSAVKKAVAQLGTLPKGLICEVKGTSVLLTETLNSLQVGLLAAIVIILLLLAANYQSFGLALAVMSTVPAVILGALLLLLLTGSTLNLQSYMGLIMSVGVSVANAILIITNAEALRIEYRNPFKASSTAASVRLRPILMTSIAMVVGMIPMASGLGESGDQSAPLGRAVIGGLIASTFAALFIAPLVYAWVQQKRTFNHPSLLPEDEPNHQFYEEEIQARQMD